jgi:hypothetical protein
MVFGLTAESNEMALDPGHRTAIAAEKVELDNLKSD